MRWRGLRRAVDAADGILVAMESNRQGEVVREKWSRLARLLLLVLSALVYTLGFLHLRADFPNGSPWMDVSKIADEGWYAGAAIHYFMQGRWYLPGVLNPAVAMPVWPAMLVVWFKMTGVSMLATRALTMVLYGVSLVLLYRLVWKARPGRTAAVVVLLTVANPFCYAFNRLAILEPVSVLWLLLALCIAGETRSGDNRGDKRGEWLKLPLLGLVIFLLALTNAAGVVLVPAVFYMLWAGWGWPGLRAMGWRGGATFAVVLGVAATLWEGYVRLLVRSHHAADWALGRSLHGAHVALQALPGIAWEALLDGGWISPVLFWLAVLMTVLSIVWLRELWRRPLFGTAVIAALGQMMYMAYYGDLEPRSFAVIAMPVMIVVGLGVAAVMDRRRLSGRANKRVRWAAWVAVLSVMAGLGMGAVKMAEFVMHPDYSYWEAAQGIAAVIDADGGEKPMLLSVSGDDLTLWAGIPAVSAGPMPDRMPGGLDAVLRRYQPGWYAAWQGWQDETTAQLEKRYRLDAVAQYRVFDDPARQTLVLYKMTQR